jgi:hypothetical protein
VGAVGGTLYHMGFRTSVAHWTLGESLRDIETCVGAVGGTLYHMGFRTSVAHWTLADANEARDWRIYADFAQTLVATARWL